MRAIRVKEIRTGAVGTCTEKIESSTNSPVIYRRFVGFRGVGDERSLLWR